MLSGVVSFLSVGLLFFAVTPTSDTLKLQNHSIGTGGVNDATSDTLRLDATAGEQSDARASSDTLELNSGRNEVQQANAPAAPTFTNDNNWYNKLHIIIDDANNPSDAVFAVAISDDNFVTTEYVQSDMTVGPTLGAEDYLTYSSWGSATGVDIIGLTSSTTYKTKVKAMHGDFSESGYSAEASASTVAPSITFDIDIAATDTDTSPPFSISYGEITPDTVTTSSDKIWLDFDTNAADGGKIFISGSNGGLLSAATSYSISSATGNLSGLGEGFGAQSASATQTTGGPLTALAPYNSGSEQVGIIDQTIREIYESSAAISGGRASINLKLKSSTLTPSAADYSETITIISSASF